MELELPVIEPPEGTDQLYVTPPTAVIEYVLFILPSQALALPLMAEGAEGMPRTVMA